MLDNVFIMFHMEYTPLKQTLCLVLIISSSVICHGLLTPSEIQMFRSHGAEVTDDDNYWYIHLDDKHRYLDNITVITIPKSPSSGPKCLNTGYIAVTVQGIPVWNPTHIGPMTSGDCQGQGLVGGAFTVQQVLRCMESEKSMKFVGVALDGHPIYGHVNIHGDNITSSMLDLCHGRVHNRRYMYHLTLDYPYLMSCYKGHTNINSNDISSTTLLNEECDIHCPMFGRTDCKRPVFKQKYVPSQNSNTNNVDMSDTKNNSSEHYDIITINGTYNSTNVSTKKLKNRTLLTRLVQGSLYSSYTSKSEFQSDKHVTTQSVTNVNTAVLNVKSETTNTSHTASNFKHSELLPSVKSVASISDTRRTTTTRTSISEYSDSFKIKSVEDPNSNNLSGRLSTLHTSLPNLPAFNNKRTAKQYLVKVDSDENSDNRDTGFHATNSYKIMFSSPSSAIAEENSNKVVNTTSQNIKWSNKVDSVDKLTTSAKLPTSGTNMDSMNVEMFNTTKSTAYHSKILQNQTEITSLLAKNGTQSPVTVSYSNGDDINISVAQKAGFSKNFSSKSGLSTQVDQEITEFPVFSQNNNAIRSQFNGIAVSQSNHISPAEVTDQTVTVGNYVIKNRLDNVKNDDSQPLENIMINTTTPANKLTSSVVNGVQSKTITDKGSDKTTSDGQKSDMESSTSALQNTKADSDSHNTLTASSVLINADKLNAQPTSHEVVQSDNLDKPPSHEVVQSDNLDKPTSQTGTSSTLSSMLEKIDSRIEQSLQMSGELLTTTKLVTNSEPNLLTLILNSIKKKTSTISSLKVTSTTTSAYVENFANYFLAQVSIEKNTQIENDTLSTASPNNTISLSSSNSTSAAIDKKTAMAQKKGAKSSTTAMTALEKAVGMPLMKIGIILGVVVCLVSIIVGFIGSLVTDEN